MKVHLDTDLGGDPDDGCALALLLGWPDAEVLAVTTNLDHKGRRAGCVSHCLTLAGRGDVPVVAGAGTTLAGERHDPTWGDPRYWPDPPPARPAAEGAATARLRRSIDEGATIICIGALTNLARVEQEDPGRLDKVPVVVMGGWVEPLGSGLPPWGPDRDWNLQCDPEAAGIVLASGADLTLVTIPATIGVQLRRAHLARLGASGPLGALLARQSEAWAEDRALGDLAATHGGLAPDMVNFHWDPVTCAVALAWPVATTAEVRLHTDVVDRQVRCRPDPAGRPVRHVSAVDAEAFTKMWLDCAERVGAVLHRDAGSTGAGPDAQ